MFCKKCGSKLSEELDFCVKCGEKVSEEGSIDQKINPQILETNPNISDIKVASMGRRISNSIIDFICICIFILLFVGLTMGFVSDIMTDFYASLICFFPIAFIYYVFFESIWQKTPGKFLTKTKVVMVDGSKPNFTHILVRTLCRIIAYLLRGWFTLSPSNPIGWHDKLSGTLVVPDSYSLEDIKKINIGVMPKNTIFLITVATILWLAVIAVLALIVIVGHK